MPMFSLSIRYSNIVNSNRGQFFAIASVSYYILIKTRKQRLFDDRLTIGGRADEHLINVAINVFNYFDYKQANASLVV